MNAWFSFVDVRRFMALTALGACVCAAVRAFEDAGKVSFVPYIPFVAVSVAVSAVMWFTPKKLAMAAPLCVGLLISLGQFMI